ncbi:MULTISPECIES: hypothetical protein [unclassified Cupriavidus]|uniref:rolling circle replication-associated protein n=1 Tax=unclassified Cupriavidus TaxID=2640874 RepID=UPI001C000A43|nr:MULTISPECIES: hypothetical protein [unclassified Cupriavidus]MCA3187160.1 hypothetical protein [Cupriavidus sp.]MCA3189222.1 hypothetical protein [Cupriavidus sp.]MCA3195302.1 hypothetical protein [Cupriavidus sp.]MCA3200857.1 hypothetical protein [Cupriavidus sp.]MCA3232772.1 hypothetical protein [Cupriavidus sp.]
MDNAMVGHDWQAGEVYREGLAVRVRHMQGGQVEISGFPTTAWRKRDLWLAEGNKVAARGESEHKETNQERSARRSVQSIRLRCKSICADRMLTLSTRECITDLDKFAALFDAFRRGMRKHREFEYVAVPERQKRGAWHLHIAVHGKTALRLAIAVWNRVLGGKGNGYCHIRNPGRSDSKRNNGKQWEGHRLAAYISKYISKDVSEHELNSKRYWTSRGIVVPEKATWGTSIGYESMYEALKPVLSYLEGVAGLDDLVAHISAKNGSFWLATGPRFCGPVMPTFEESI